MNKASKRPMAKERANEQRQQTSHGQGKVHEQSQQTSHGQGKGKMNKASKHPMAKEMGK